MSPRPTTQEHHRSRNILRLPHSSIRIRLIQLLLASTPLHQHRSHLAHKETRRNTVDENVSGPELDSEVAREMEHGGFGGGVRVCAGFTEGADAEAGDGAGYDDAGGGLDGGLLCEEGGESGG